MCIKISNRYSCVREYGMKVYCFTKITTKVIKRYNKDKGGQKQEKLRQNRGKSEKIWQLDIYCKRKGFLPVAEDTGNCV